MAFTYEYSRPALTVDCVVFGLDEEDLKVLREHFHELAALARRDRDIHQSHSIDEARERHESKRHHRAKPLKTES